MKALAIFPRTSGRIARLTEQQGVVLLTVLIALVAISLAAMSLIRTVDTGTMIAGNLAFKQGGTQSADTGTEAATVWMEATGSTTLQSAVGGAAFYSPTRLLCDYTGKETPSTADDVNWSGGGGGCGSLIPADVPLHGAPAPSLPPGYAGKYVVVRMCDTMGAPVDANCERYVDPNKSPGTSKNVVDYQVPLSPPPRPYYLVTTRIEGPRNTVSYVQAAVVL